MNVSRMWWISLGLIVGIVLGGGNYYLSLEGNKNSWMPLEVRRVAFKATVSAQGQIVPEKLIQIKPPIDGRIEKVLIKEGEVVKKLQILAWMSSVDRVVLLDGARSRGSKELTKWQKVYRPTAIYSPIDGQVLHQDVVEGQSVSKGQALFDVSDGLLLKAEVDESDIRHIQLGQSVDVKIDAYPGENLVGQVDYVSLRSVVVDQVNVFEVRVRLDPTHLKIRDGMGASAAFVYRKAPQAQVLPVWFTQGRENVVIDVQVKGRSGEIAKRVIKVGYSNGDWVEILDPISDWETILYRPAQIYGNSEVFRLFRKEQ